MKKNTKHKKRSSRKILLGAAAILFIQIVLLTSLAFYQGFDLVTNRLSTGNLEILLLENQYDLTPESDRDIMVPNKQTPKDPRIVNIKETDAFVFLKITVPVVKSTDVEADGTKTAKTFQELFRIKTERNKNVENRDTDFNVYTDDGNDNYWIELHECEEGTDLSGSTRTYVFGYSVYLKQDEYTETLFDYVQLKNIIQYEVAPNVAQNIEVKAYGIQADYLGSIQKDNGNHKRVMNEEQLTIIFSDYLNYSLSHD